MNYLPSRRWWRQPWVWILLATLLGMAVTASLGRWQLGRAAQKEAWASQRLAREALPPVAWSALRAAAEAQADLQPWHDRRIELQGVWQPGSTVFLENRPMAGQAGFYVLTLLRPLDGGPSVLVQRGWTPRRLDDRTAVPVVPTPSEPVWVSGRLAPPPSRLMALGPDSSGPIRQNIDLTAYAAEQSALVLAAAVVQAEPAMPADGLKREWTRPDADVHKHYGYALQWFGLCLLMACLYVWFQLIAPRRQRA
jgi:surfeit locus 1 family protein